MNIPFIVLALLMVGLSLALVAKNVSDIASGHQQTSSVVKKKKPRRDQFPGGTQPGTAPGGAIEDRSDDVEEV